MSSSTALADLPPIARRTLSGTAYEALTDLLASGRLAPGDRLSLRHTAAALGVSVMPIREAVSRLVADGALEVAPNRAVRVPMLDAEEFRALAETRMAVEGWRRAGPRNGAAPGNSPRSAGPRPPSAPSRDRSSRTGRGRWCSTATCISRSTMPVDWRRCARSSYACGSRRARSSTSICALIPSGWPRATPSGAMRRRCRPSRPGRRGGRRRHRRGHSGRGGFHHLPRRARREDAR